LRLVVGCQRGVGSFRRAHIFSEAEVQHFDAAFFRQHYVGGFQIAMNDSFVVSRGECVAQCVGDLNDLR
jgi:hypothetical protein